MKNTKKALKHIDQKKILDNQDPQTASIIVPYEYPDNIKSWSGIVLVGEAPGKEEARLLRPFVGRSGKLLDENLTKAGIERENCLVANVFRFRPPQNKVDFFFSSRKAAKIGEFELAEELGRFGSLWCKEEYKSEIKELQTVLKDISPKIIVALGRTPFWALTGGNGLLSQVGQRMDCRLLPGTPVIPTYHPSFILRGNWKLQDTWQEHFIAALQHK